MYARQYVENDLLDKTPVELIRLLYSKAIEKVQVALRHTCAGEVRERNSALARAMEIVAELQGALNLEAGADLALQLARLYDYIQRQLIEAAADSVAVDHLKEVRVLLVNLYEGWQECEPPPLAAPQEWESNKPHAAAQALEQEIDSGGELPAMDEMPSPLASSGSGGDHVWTL